MACGVETAGGSPTPVRRIVQLRARERDAAAIRSPCNKHLAVGQQRRRVKTACRVEIAGGSPTPARRIIQFRARGNAAGISKSRRDKHLAVGQQRRRVLKASGAEIAGGSPTPARGSIQFRARQKRAVKSPCNKHLAIGQQRRRVLPACGVEVAGAVEWGKRHKIEGLRNRADHLNDGGLRFVWLMPRSLWLKRPGGSAKRKERNEHSDKAKKEAD